GLSSVTANQLLIANAAGTGFTQVATSSLGLTTTNVAEGTNQYYTLARVAAAIAGTTTDALAEGGTNQYYTNARARAAYSSTVTGLTYTSGTGVLSLTSGYNIPLTASTTEWNAFYTTPSSRITAGTNLSWSGNTLNGPSDAYVRGLVSAEGPLAYNSSTGAFSLPMASSTAAGYLAASDFAIFDAKQDALSFTYPIQNSGNTISLAFGTTTANTWSQTQQFAGGASTTQMSVVGTAYFGGSATSTFNSAGQLSLAGLSNTLLYANSLGVVSSASVASPLTFAAGSISVGDAAADGSTKGIAAFTANDFDAASGVVSLDYANGQKATTAQAGFLTAADWNTFNDKFATTSTNYWLTTQSTSNLAEGSNLYYTLARFANALAGTTTDALAEGSTNQYFTAARVASYISGSSTIPHVGGSAYGDLLSWNGSAWETRATSSLGISGGGAVDSVFGRTGAVTAQSGDYSTSLVTEGTNLYYTDARARAALSSSATGLTYTSGTGAFSLTAGYSIPLTASTTEWASAYANRITSATSPLSITNNVLSIAQASGSLAGFLSSTDWNTFNNKENILSFSYPLTRSLNAISLAFGTTTSNTWGGTQTFGNTTATNATTTTFGLNSETFTDLTGSGLVNTAGALTLDRTGAWTGTFDGQEGTYYLANSFSTTSATYFETQQTARNADDLSNNSIEDLSDVASMTEAFGNLLAWTGSAWSNIATSTLGLAISDTTGVLSQSRGGTGISSYTSGDILYVDNSGDLAVLPKGTNGQVLKLTGGLPAWGTDITSGGGGGATAWSTTTDSLAVYPSDTSDVLIVGGSATSTANSILEVLGTSYFSNTLGIATTSPSAAFKFAVQGNALFSGTVSLGNLLTSGTATSSNLSITGITSTLLK
ncbi:MAG: hypothetical protein AAB921_03815, partial [Patescibacteria group bacterium]